MASSRRSSRETSAAEVFGLAAEAVGTLAPGCAVFAITHGQWSMVDAIRACLEQTGPAHLSVWTWCLGDYETDVIGGLRVNGAILSARLVIDPSAARLEGTGELASVPQIARWIARHGEGSVRCVKNHAKIARLWNEQWRLLLRGSMNLNHNARFEQFDLSEGGPAFELVADVEEALPTLDGAVTAADNAPQLIDDLRLFDTRVRTWSPNERKRRSPDRPVRGESPGAAGRSANLR